jgi:hypothetical protein
MATRPATSSSTSDHLLRNTLRANSIFCMLSGLLLTVASEPIATFLGWSTFIPLIVIGILLILYGAMLFRRVLRAPIDSRTGMVYAIADSAWVIVSLLLLLTNLVPFTTEGKWAIAIQAVIVAVFAMLQFLGAQRVKRSII